MRGGYRPGAGRKPIADKIIVRDIRLSAEDYALIPGNRAEYMRNAIIQRLITDGLKKA